MLSVNLFLPPFQIVGLAILKIKQSVLDIQMSETCRLHLALEDYLNQKFVNRWIAGGGEGNLADKTARTSAFPSGRAVQFQVLRTQMRIH